MKIGGLVSIIIPVFNVSPYLTEALDSVIHQSYENLEIIIIDDGSTDGSGEICDKYAEDDRRVIVVHQENRGLSCARNVGLDIMTGEVVAFLDSDDAFHPDYIKNMAEAMVLYQTDIVICKITIINSLDRMVPDYRKKTMPRIEQGIYRQEETLRALAGGNINPSVWNKLYNRKLWDEIRFPAGRVFEDLDTMYRVLEHCERVYVLDESLYLHRKRQGSITKTRSRKYMDDYILACSHFEDFIREKTPGLFTQEQLNRIRRLPLNKMINFYFHLCRSDGNEEKRFLNDLRRQIITMGKELGLGNSSLRKRVVYWMICYFPSALRMIYPVYDALRRY